MKLFHRRHFPLDHYVLVDDARNVAPDLLIAEARRQAEELAAHSTGDSQNFTLIQNGSGIARRPDPHVHIFCTGSRTMKGLLLMVIGVKNVFQGLALKNSVASPV